MHSDRGRVEGSTRAGLTRRAFVVRGGWAALATVGIGILAACTPTSPANSGGSSSTTAAPGATTRPAASGKVQLPTYVAPKGPAADVPGSDTIPDGYTLYPKSPTQTVPTPPGDGGDVTIAGETFNPLIPIEQNTLWQQLNKVMNVKLNAQSRSVQRLGIRQVPGTRRGWRPAGHHHDPHRRRHSRPADVPRIQGPGPHPVPQRRRRQGISRTSPRCQPSVGKAWSTTARSLRCRSRSRSSTGVCGATKRCSRRTSSTGQRPPRISVSN